MIKYKGKVPTGYNFGWVFWNFDNSFKIIGFFMYWQDFKKLVKEE